MTATPGFEVRHIGHITGGQGYLGEGYAPTAEQMAVIAQETPVFIRPVTKQNTVQCMDARNWATMGEIDDPDTLARMAHYTSAGGLVLTAANAAVGINHKIVRGVNSFTTVYNNAEEIMAERGLEDAGHGGEGVCGAASNQVSALTKRLSPREVRDTLEPLGLYSGPYEMRRFRTVDGNWSAQLDNHPGFFEGWTAGLHSNLIKKSNPSNFATVQTQGADNKNHTPAGLLFIEGDGYGLAKNARIKEGHPQFLTVTVAALGKIATALSPNNPEEQRQAIAAMKYHLVQVGAKLFAGQQMDHPGMTVFRATPITA